MIRKTLHIIISALLLISISGFSISNHYCRGKLVSVTINHETKPCCETNGCCHNETKVFQLKGNFDTPAFLDISNISFTEIASPVFDINTNDLIYSEKIAVNITSESPPPITIQIRLSFIQTYLC